MASNIIPKNQDDLLILVQSMVGGLRGHETSLGVKQNTEARMAAAAKTLRDAEMAFGQSRKDWADARKALKSADATARAFLLTARKVLTTRLGERWGAGWEATGFPGQSTAVPETQPERFQLCQALQKYFADNPAAEVAVLGVTTAAAQAQHESIRAARAALNRSAAARADALKARDTAYAQLRRRAQGLVAEIGDLRACLRNQKEPMFMQVGGA
ncbi:MAG: hypothetical protein HZA89_11945 [Verrucomicrobia bacterium]|nr:hypothetical protein [Verrucomicrobiota bacterium]